MPPTDPNTSLKLTRTIKASREKVFDAFVIPELRKQWWGTEPGDRCTLCEMDVRVGGRYRINMIKKENEYIVNGEYHEVGRPEKLVFTWTWEAPSSEEVKDTLVTITFKALSAKTTELTIRHERFKTTTMRDRHSEGWTGCMKSVATFVE